jgi:plasmid stability protein
VVGGCCDTVEMKNITVSVDDELYRRARVRAAELDTSVSAVVRSFLQEFARGETDAERRKRIQHETLASISEFRAGDRLTRDDVHDRDALR